MDKLDQLINKIKAFKEELAKSELAKEDGKGVHIGHNPKEPGRSAMGILNSLGESGAAKEQAKATLKELKKLPKPKLVKARANGQWYLD